jgi:hypothetical protein
MIVTIAFGRHMAIVRPLWRFPFTVTQGLDVLSTGYDLMRLEASEKR